MRIARYLSVLLALVTLAGQARAENYSDIWWNPNESGWGLTIADHETQIFAVWYTYRANGTPTWMVIPGGTFSQGRRIFDGEVYETIGPPYAGVFNPAAVGVAKVGTVNIDFSPPGLGSGVALFRFAVGSSTQSKQIQRQGFGNSAAAFGADFTDIWWNANESGWGLTLAQHGNNIFGVWYTYGADGKPLFVVMPGVTFTSPTAFSGALYTTTGPSFAAPSFDPSQVRAAPIGNATVSFTGRAGTFTTIINGLTQQRTIVPQAFGLSAPSNPIGHYQLAKRGVWAQFDRRGYPNGYWNGDAVRTIDQFDQDLQNNVGPSQQVAATVGAELADQMQTMVAMGINSISFELRATDSVFIPGGFVPPGCNIPPSLGFLYPQPTALELANLTKFLNLAQSHGIRVLLLLNNTHMEEMPPTNNNVWVSSILNMVKGHPALDTVIFGGSVKVLHDPDRCGIPAEAPLYLGTTSLPGRYIKWAIALGLSLGIPSRQLSAEAIVGNYFVDVLQPPAGSEATDSHLWYTVGVLKSIWEELSVPPSGRAYVLSFYSQRKCFNPNNFNLPCIDADPHTWADQVLQNALTTIGANSGGRVIAAEFGNHPESGLLPEQSFESLTAVMSRYGIEGGAYWIWNETDEATEATPNLAGEPVRLRGRIPRYNAVQRELADAYGFHLDSIANASFEAGGTTADHWTASGPGTARRFRLADEAGQPVPALRGNFALRLVSGASANDRTSITSEPVAVSPGAVYTTTANLRFKWTGDPILPSPDPARPNVYISTRYFQADGGASGVRASDDFRFFQENGVTGFATFPVFYSPPSDARTVRVEIGAARNGLAQPIQLDVDNVR